MNESSAASDVTRLQHALRRSNMVCLLSVTALSGMLLMGFARSPVQDVIRARQIIVEDEHGQARVVIAAPVPDELVGFTRQQSTSGIVIMNELGEEQFGLGTSPDGSITMGMDTRKGVGDDRNTERITFSVNKNGDPKIRLLDNHTRVTTSLWSSEEGGQIAFYDWTPMQDGKTEFVGFMNYGKESGYVRNK
jgi:hypothetical protein